MASPSSHLPSAPVYLDEPRGTFGPRQFLVRLIGFCAGMIVVLAVCRAVALPPGGGTITAKAGAFHRTADQYDTLFVGTSRVYRWFAPADFDELMGECGYETSSYNMGVPGASFYELHYVLRDALARGENLKRVFFEYVEVTPQIDPQNAFKPRVVYWHDAQETALAVETALRLEDDRTRGRPYVEDPRGANSLPGMAFGAWPDHARIAYEHVKHFLSREFMVGCGKDVARGLLGRESPEVQVMIDHQGYRSLEAELARCERRGYLESQYDFRRQSFLEGREEYLAHVEAMKGDEPVFGDTEWYNCDLGIARDLEVVEHVIADAHEAGVELVLVVMPGNSRDEAFTRRLVEELGVRVLVYNDPERHPEFYDPDMRFDSGHPSVGGAARFTRQLALDLLKEGIR